MSRRRARFFSSLARLTRAGISVTRAGAIMRDHAIDGPSRGAVEALQTGIERGESIADSLRPSLSQLEYGMVGAAERGGRLSEGFAHLERYHELIADMTDRIRKAAAYPLLLLHAAALSTGVVAYLAGLSPVPAILRALIVLWAALLLLAIAIKGLIALGGRSVLIDRFLRAIPLAGTAWKNFALTRWSAVMHFNITSGRTFSAALESAAGAAGSAMLAAATKRLAAAAAGGQSIAEAMKHERIFPGYFAMGFATAEASGTLDEETEMQTKSCMEAAASSMVLVAEWMPRVLYLAAVIYAAWQILQLAGSIGGQYQRALDGF